MLRRIALRFFPGLAMWLHRPAQKHDSRYCRRSKMVAFKISPGPNERDLAAE
jgi:hypothetical protein